ncbi:MAG: 2-succinyl-5-enolpyruvyl-6-hydroxy-3-cyclohexene-1-carboxylic-acid synthase [Acidimicrobiales bacterium]
MDESTVAATFCATLVDEFARGGVTDAVVAPGSRSTPLTVALARDERIRVHVHVDERSAGFLALGLGLATGRPAVVVTTSGTAAVELHPAVAEADLAGVPLLACTTDRPPELHGVGAPQTVDQAGLYGRSARAMVEPGVPREEAAWSWRSLAARAVLDATGSRPGPVHLNLAFTEPLLGEPAAVPAGRADGAPWHQTVPMPTTVTVVEELAGRRGVIVAGRGSEPTVVTPVAEVLGWPVLADPLSGCRRLGPTTVAGFDLLARSGAWAEAHLPEAVVWVGARPTSKMLAAWLRDVPIQVVVDGTSAFVDPDRAASHRLAGLLGAEDREPPPAEWLDEWRAADDAAQAVLDGALGQELSDPGVARAVLGALPSDASLVVASSMPIRDVEWFGGTTEGRVLANRGANGIDGVVSTAVGVALAGQPTVALVGDLAFLHDTNALLGAADRECPLTVVVVDNDGGGIFSFLPQAEQLPAEEFERLFGTPHGLDLVEVARAHGVEASPVESLDELAAAVAEPVSASRVRVVCTDRQANVAVHQRLYAAVVEALAEL